MNEKENLVILAKAQNDSKQQFVYQAKKTRKIIFSGKVQS
jgi:hypothetical protein